MKITHRKVEDVPAQPNRPGRMSSALKSIMDELERVAPGMVMVIEMGQGDSIRATKALVARASNELNMPVRQWHSGNQVYAHPVKPTLDAMERAERAARGDHRD